jgi:hypothetical protein
MALRCAARSVAGIGGLASVQDARRRRQRSAMERTEPLLQVGQMRWNFDGVFGFVVGMRGIFMPGADLCKFVQGFDRTETASELPARVESA